MKQNVTTSEKIDSFELKLPEPFDVKPAYEVELPAKCKALVYNDTVVVTDYASGAGRHAEAPGWRVVVVNRHGRTPQATASGWGHYLSDDFRSSDALEVMRFLQRVTIALSRKKSTRIEDVDCEE